MPFMAPEVKSLQLSLEEVEQLNQKLIQTRHTINNQLSLIIAAVELMKRKPDAAERLIEEMATQPSRIAAEIEEFSRLFEITLRTGRYAVSEKVQP